MPAQQQDVKDNVSSSLRKRIILTGCSKEPIRRNDSDFHHYDELHESKTFFSVLILRPLPHCEPGH